MKLFWVTCDLADLCYLVEAKTNTEARSKVLALAAKPVAGNDLASIKRLREVAKSKHCGPHVLLRASECKASLPGLYSLHE